MGDGAEPSLRVAPRCHDCVRGAPPGLPRASSGCRIRALAAGFNEWPPQWTRSRPVFASRLAVKLLSARSSEEFGPRSIWSPAPSDRRLDEPDGQRRDLNPAGTRGQRESSDVTVPDPLGPPTRTDLRTPLSNPTSARSERPIGLSSGIGIV